MEIILPEQLRNIVIIASLFSMISMVFMQNIKAMNLATKRWQINLWNFVLSFAVGIPFGMTFYNLSWIDSIWVGVFSFLGATAMYKFLRNPKRMIKRMNNNNIEIPIEHVITRKKS